MPDPADLPAFVRAYEAAHATRRVLPATDTVAGLIAAYLASEDWRRLAATTQREYGRALERIRCHFGAMLTLALGAPGVRADVRRWRDSMADRPRAADYAVEVLSALAGWAERYGHIPRSEVRGIEALHRADRSAIIWEPGELEALIAASSPSLRPLVVVAAYTGLRQGDLRALTWGAVDIEAGVIDLATGKSRGRTRAIPPLLPEARAVLEGLPRQAVQVFLTRYGRPWTASGLDSEFRKARERAGVHKRFHDLRGTAVTMFAAAGFSPHEIAGFVGWEPSEAHAIIRRYASRKAVASAAVERMRRTPQKQNV